MCHGQACSLLSTTSSYSLITCDTSSDSHLSKLDYHLIDFLSYGSVLPSGKVAEGGRQHRIRSRKESILAALSRTCPTPCCLSSLIHSGKHGGGNTAWSPQRSTFRHTPTSNFRHPPLPPQNVQVAMDPVNCRTW